jgi:putative transposase
MGETIENTEKAFDLFIKTYKLKYPKATQCLEKDREELLAFFRIYLLTIGSTSEPPTQSNQPFLRFD